MDWLVSTGGEKDTTPNEKLVCVCVFCFYLVPNIVPVVVDGASGAAENMAKYNGAGTGKVAQGEVWSSEAG